MAIFVSMLEFFQTGAFGSLRLKMPRRQIEEIVGPPDDYGILSRKERRRYKEEDHWKYSGVWVYGSNGDNGIPGSVQLFFDEQHSLWYILIDYLYKCLPSGGEKMQIDPWILHPGLSLEEARATLTQSQLRYHTRQDPFYEGIVHLVLETGVVLYFDVEAKEESRSTGIQRLYFPDTMKDFYDEAGNMLPRKRPKGGAKTGK
ncbi:hypothetical protein [Ktedonobacter racemifer]|jgi:hypothetical protein|uniref:Uncharacterized protein n=1 Tax=Ktedonobacter racemifer DSM 44963 TaxID=485913 RepID=D6U1Y9_KTERA|nr:hypothetical protein [Ktedonobacter racemifer]EFH80873.1 hypothetical protein Krac_1505 [Ktedonobacter racemifer DSM 44963]